jgi:hypothetical protein
MQRRLDTGAKILGSVPDPTAQKIALVTKGVSEMGKTIKVVKTTVPVKRHIRHSKSGKLTVVKSHRRTVKKKYTI